MLKIVAVDVGYGYTKVTDGKMALSFPSIAPVASSGALSSHVLKPRNTVVVEVGGERFEVGPDVELALSGQHARVLTDLFYKTKTYRALVQGSMALLGYPGPVDVLVLGLPMSSYGMAKTELSRLYGDLAEEVLVLPQPLGSYVRHMRQVRRMDMLALTIDVGFLTVDWMLARGLTPVESRSGAYPGGMSVILKEMARMIGEDMGRPFGNITLLDKALRGVDRRLMLHGQSVDLMPYVDRIKPLLSEAMDAVKSGIGTDEDVEWILLTGGASWLYDAPARQAFAGHRVDRLEEASMGNVRGFYEAGVMLSSCD